MLGLTVQIETDAWIKMVSDVERLQKREQELLESNTALLEKLRASDRTQMVREFFTIADQRKPERVGDFTEAELRLGLRLVAEEFAELCHAALGQPDCFDTNAWAVWNSLGALQEFIDKAPVNVMLPQLVDGIVDLLYVLDGLGIRLGVDLRPVFKLVHEANMAKRGGPVDEHGKRGKPEGWKPPDVGAELRRQGWVEP